VSLRSFILLGEDSYSREREADPIVSGGTPRGLAARTTILPCLLCLWRFSFFLPLDRFFLCPSAQQLSNPPRQLGKAQLITFKVVFLTLIQVQVLPLPLFRRKERMKPIPTSPIQSSYFVQDLSSVVCFDKEILFSNWTTCQKNHSAPNSEAREKTHSRMKYRWDPTPLLCSRASFDPISNSALSTYSPPLLPRILMKEDRNTHFFSYGSVPASGPPLFPRGPIRYRRATLSHERDSDLSRISSKGTLTPTQRLFLGPDRGLAVSSALLLLLSSRFAALVWLLQLSLNSVYGWATISALALPTSDPERARERDETALSKYIWSRLSLLPPWEMTEKEPKNLNQGKKLAKKGTDSPHPWPHLHFAPTGEVFGSER